MRVIDSHLHLWKRQAGLYPWLKPEMGGLFQDFSAEQAREEMLEAGVDGAILVQADDSMKDSEDMFALAHEHDWILGVVAWVPLDDPARAGSLLERWEKEPALCGIRQLVHDDPRPEFYPLRNVGATAALLAARNLPLDIPDAWPRDFPHVVALADNHPELVIVIDHLGKPPVESEDLERWEKTFRLLGERANTVVKFSGLHHPHRPFNARSTSQLFDLSLEVFGPQRMMLGSDWPITVASGGYQPTWTTFQELLAPLSASEKGHLSALTAQRVYGTSHRVATMTKKENH